MTRAFNIEGLVRLQNYMGGKTLSDARFFAVLNADVVEMIDGEESTTKRRYFRIAENDESITFSCILGSSQQQMVVTKATKQLDVTTTEIGGGITPGSITTEMLADGAVTSGKISYQAVISEKISAGAVVSTKIGEGAVTSEKLAAGLDVSGLFFIVPDDAQYPYQLTESDKAALLKATFLIVKTGTGVSVPLSRASGASAGSYLGNWYGAVNPEKIIYSYVSPDSIESAKGTDLSGANAVKFTSQTLTAEQKTQARTNIGAAEDPNTSGDPQATLEEPPVVDEEPIP